MVALQHRVRLVQLRRIHILIGMMTMELIIVLVQKFTMLFDVKPDLVYLGHRHTNAMETVYDTKVIQSGCLSGTDNYALSKRLRNKPEQTISVITENGLECLYDIKFD